AEGGVLVVGRNDNGEPVGVSNAQKLLEELPNKIRDLLGIMVSVKLVRIKAKDLVEIHVDPYPNPISYRGEDYVRSGSTKQELKGFALERFLLRNQPQSWDSVPVAHVTVKELSKTALAQFRKRAPQSQRLVVSTPQDTNAAPTHKLNLLAGGNLKRAALL